MLRVIMGSSRRKYSRKFRRTRADLPAFIALLLTGSIQVCPTLAHGNHGETFKDSRGNSVYLPMGRQSFADEVVIFKPGNPPPYEKWSNPIGAIGSPDYKGESDEKPTCVTLGGYGSLIVRFSDNVLIDGPGPDLYVWEVGPSIEATKLEISSDGRKWINIGKIQGGTASIDIHDYVRKGDVFRYVRLTDLGTAIDKGYSGADIDAIAAIGSGFQIVLPDSVLFDFDKADLKEEAKMELNKVIGGISQIRGASVIVDGHTDNTGEQDYNLDLSKRRANAVRTYMISQGIDTNSVTAQGFGESRPVTQNTTEAGRARNRRVEIVILPEAIDDTKTNALSVLGGTWQSTYGPVTFVPANLNPDGTATFTGYWQHGSSERGIIKSAVYQPGARKLTFTYYQDWNDKTGSAQMFLSADSKTMTGTWKQPGDSGAWKMNR